MASPREGRTTEAQKGSSLKKDKRAKPDKEDVYIFIKKAKIRELLAGLRKLYVFIKKAKIRELLAGLLPR